MANRTATLIRYAKLPNLGWRRGTLVKAKNGQFKPGVMIYSGTEHDATNGCYQIRIYKGRTAIHVSVGDDLAAAQVLLTKHNATRAKEAAEAMLGIAPAPKTQEDRKTISELAAAYVAKKKSPSQGLSRTSTHLYETTLNAFVKSCAKRVFASDVTEDDVTGYCDLLVKQGYAPKSRAMRYTLVRGFLQTCGVDLKSLIESATHKRLGTKPEGDTTPYTKAEVEKLLAVSTPYYKMVFTLLLSTGMRFKEASHLTWANVLWDEGKISIPGSQRVTNRGKVKEFQTKNRKSRKIPLYASLRSALLEWRKANSDTVYVVGSLRGDQPNNHWLQYGKKFWRKAGLNCGVCDSCAEKSECGNFYLHKFRHSYAHRFLDVNPDIYELSRNLGHHSVEITTIYLKGRTSNTSKDPFTDAA